MRALLAAIALLSAGGGAACDAPVAEVSVVVPAHATCVDLLRAVRTLAPKISWTECNAAPRAPEPVAATAGAAPPPPPMPAHDAAHCRLLDPAAPALDACLVAAIARVEPVAEPRCPRARATIALGDLAFFVLTDRHPTLWDEALPEAARADAEAFQRWIEREGHRDTLARAVERVLAGRQ